MSQQDFAIPKLYMPCPTCNGVGKIFLTEKIEVDGIFPQDRPDGDGWKVVETIAHNIDPYQDTFVYERASEYPCPTCDGAGRISSDKSQELAQKKRDQQMQLVREREAWLQSRLQSRLRMNYLLIFLITVILIFVVLKIK